MSDDSAVLIGLLVGCLVLGLLALILVPAPARPVPCNPATVQAAHPAWTLAQCEKICKQIAWIGMTREQAVASWGQPNDVNTTITAYGKHEQWVYYGEGVSAQYLYFENGVLTSIQQ